MKIKELFEDKSVEKEATNKALLALGTKIIQYLNSSSDSTLGKNDPKFSMSGTGRYVQITLDGEKFPNVHLSADVEHIIVGKNKITPTIFASINVSVAKGMADFMDQMDQFVADEFKRPGFKFKSPWHFEDHSSFTVSSLKIGELPTYVEPGSAIDSTSSPQPKYDPQQAYYDRMTPAAKSRQRAISNHQFSNSIGGDSSNYR